MDRSRIAARWRNSLGWLSLAGRLRVSRPGALVAAALIIVLALALPSRWMLFLAYAYVLLLLLAYLWVRIVGASLHIERQSTSTLAQVGDDLEEHWSLENRGLLPLPWVAIDGGATLPGYSARRVASASGGKREQWRTAARCTRRGVYRLGPLTARLSDPFGIFSLTWHEQSERRIVVYPPLVVLPPMPLPRGQRGGLAQADLLQLHITPSVGGVRDYTPGDPPGRIHWPYVARYQRLVVKEFDQERAGALWLVLDLAAAAYPASAEAAQAASQPAAHRQSSVVSSLDANYRPADLADLAITLTASLAAQTLAAGRTIGLLCDDGRRRVVPPAGGPRQLWRIMNELVECEASGQRPLAELLRAGRQLGNNATVVLVTGALDAAWLPEMSLRSGGLALLVAPEAGQAAPCAELLGRRGIAARIFALDARLPLVNPPRRRVTARVSPLGRVIKMGEP